MACRLCGAKPLPEPMLAYCQLDPWEQFQWNSNWNEKENFILQNAFQSVVCEMTAILSRWRWVKSKCTVGHCLFGRCTETRLNMLIILLIFLNVPRCHNQYMGAETKWPPFNIFSNAFYLMKIFELPLKFPRDPIHNILCYHWVSRPQWVDIQWL